MLRLGLLLACIAAVGFAATPVEIIDATGKMKTVEELNQWAGRKIKSPGDRAVVVVGTAGSKGSGKSSLLNKLFDADFGVGRSLGPKAKPQGGVALCTAESGHLVCMDYDAVGTGADDSTTNGKFLALTTRLADAILLNIWSSDIGRNVPYNTLALQAIFQEQLQSEGSPKTLLVVAVHDHDARGDDEKTKDAIYQDLQAIWATVPKTDDKVDTDLQEFFDIDIAFLPHPRYRADEHALAIQDLKQRFSDLDQLSSRYSKRIERENFARSVGDYWTDIKSRNFVVLPSRIELLATYQIESQYTKAMQTVEAKLKSWKASVDRGRIISGFGESAAKLYTSVLENFDRATQPFAVSPLRLKKHKELRSTLQRGIAELVRRQLINLQTQGLKRFKSSILKYVGLDDREDKEVAVQQALEEEYKEAAAKIVVPCVPGAGAYDKAQSDYVNQLVDYSHKWPSSPAYNVQAMKRLETGAKKKRGGKASWAATFQLVSLLRTPGDGALQGFATYQAGPVQFLCGLQNDRDLPESRIEGKMPPLLRIQPKVSFDMDL